jgi:hypothetical protein
MNRIDIISVPCDDQTVITATQAKLNQWQTKKELVKVDTHTTATHIVFMVIRKKG